MFSHKYQPFKYNYRTGKIKANVINREWKEETFDELYSNFKSVYKHNFRAKELLCLTTEAAILDAMFLHKKYENILIISSYKDNFDKITNFDFTPNMNMGHHFLPIINKLNETQTNMHITQVGNSNHIFAKLYEMYGIPTIPIDEYNLSVNKFRLQEQPKSSPIKWRKSLTGNATIFYDAVVLLGIEGITKGKFQAKNIKKVFSPYCVEEWDLIDLYVGDNRTLQPIPSETQEAFINQVVSNLRVLGTHDGAYDAIVDRLIEIYKVY